MGRRRKTLYERVLANTFRPDRYGDLLARERLPEYAPFRDRRRRELWQGLLGLGRSYREQPEYRTQLAKDFAALVRSLHGAALPSWYGPWLARRPAAIDAALMALP